MVAKPSHCEPSGIVFHIMRFCVHDGPGIRTAVFLKGCPLGCWWCHNPEGQNAVPEVLYSAERCRLCGACAAACPRGAVGERDGRMVVSGDCEVCGRCAEACGAEARVVAGRRMTAAEIVAEVERDRVFFDESGGGVTFTGGEPLEQPELLEALLEGCRARGIHTAVETCGAAPRERVLAMGGMTDLILYDVKGIDAAHHREWTGAGNGNILGNLEALVREGRAVAVRLPIVPGVNDGAEDVRAACEYLARLGAGRVELVPYHTAGVAKYGRLGRGYRLEGTEAPARAGLEEMAARMRAAGIAAHIAR